MARHHHRLVAGVFWCFLLLAALASHRSVAVADDASLSGPHQGDAERTFAGRARGESQPFATLDGAAATVDSRIVGRKLRAEGVLLRARSRIPERGRRDGDEARRSGGVNTFCCLQSSS